MNRQDIEDIYTLSPMQQGMLFHTLLAPKSGTYFQQFICTFDGNLGIESFQKAWVQAIERHTILRTSFAWEKLEEPHQIVHRTSPLSFKVLDWRDISQPEQEKKLGQFLRQDRIKGFELSKAPLLRLFLIRTGDTSYRFIWGYHHLLLDNWTEFLLLKEVGALYRASSTGHPVDLPASHPYRGYVSWLRRQDLRKAEAFWRKTLQGFVEPTHLKGDRAPRSSHRAEEGIAMETITIPQALAEALRVFARKSALTLNTIVQGAWVLILSHLSGKRDVLFGNTLQSSFPATLGTRDLILGLFINTLPVRVTLPEGSRLISWLKMVQDEQLRASQFDYTPLAKIQSWSPISWGRPLFESFLVVQNYNLDAAMEAFGEELRVSDFQFVQQSNYPLMVTIDLGEELSLRISYDYRRFDLATIHGYLDLFVALFTAFVTEPEKQVESFLNVLKSQRKHHHVLRVQQWKRANRKRFMEIKRRPVCTHQVK